MYRQLSNSHSCGMLQVFTRPSKRLPGLPTAGLCSPITIARFIRRRSRKTLRSRVLIPPISGLSRSPAHCPQTPLARVASAIMPAGSFAVQQPTCQALHPRLRRNVLRATLPPAVRTQQRIPPPLVCFPPFIRRSTTLLLLLYGNWQLGSRPHCKSCLERHCTCQLVQLQ